MNKIIIAIDGYSACGKSSTAKAVAQALNYTYIDSGAMYRAVTLYFLQNFVSLDNPREVDKALGDIEIEFRRGTLTADEEAPAPAQTHTYLNGQDVEHEIRQMYVSDQVSEVSRLGDVRRFLVAQQQKMGKRKGIVMDGRDIGTVVFPQAELKLFMVAELMERAKRRQDELMELGQLVNIDQIAENLRKRDLIDTTRAESPLRQAPEAHVVDTTYITFGEQLAIIMRMAYTRILQ
jgi:CMP/dCMP kinase